MPALISVYTAIAIFHLWCILSEHRKLQAATKCLLLPVLAALYFFYAKTFSVFPILALLGGLAGDVILLKMRKNFLLLCGLLAFLIGHLFYIITFAGIAGLTLNLFFLVVTLVYTVVIIFAILKIKPPKQMRLPVCIYAAAITGMSILALQVLCRSPGIASLLIYAGSLCFVASDILLAYAVFHTMTRKMDFAVMLLYIIAQGAITAALTM
jgi:uncharacterized membrane protein YhhN